MIVQKTIFYTPTALTFYLRIVKKGPIAMIKANPNTIMEPDLFLSFQRETENMTV
nr:hypothetical protein [Fredinandcohnia onubensis]